MTTTALLTILVIEGVILFLLVLVIYLQGRKPRLGVGSSEGLIQDIDHNFQTLTKAVVSLIQEEIVVKGKVDDLKDLFKKNAPVINAPLAEEVKQVEETKQSVKEPEPPKERSLDDVLGTIASYVSEEVKNNGNGHEPAPEIEIQPQNIPSPEEQKKRGRTGRSK